MQNFDAPKSRSFIQSLAKGLRCLELLAGAGRSLSLSEIAAEMETNKPTASRICYTLQELGFVQRDKNKRYHLTPNILRLGYPAVCGMGWRDIAKYHLRQLFEAVGETVSLSVLDGEEIVFIIRFRKKQYLPFDIRMGTKIPVHCTAMGKVLMAFGEPAATRRIIERLDFKPLTHRSITDRSRYLAVLEDVREKGYAVNDEEMSVGNRSIAAPVLDKDGYAAAAIVIAVPTADYQLAELERKFSVLIVETANRISESLLKSDTTPATHGNF